MKTLPLPKVQIIEYAGRGNLMMRYKPPRGPAITRTTMTTDRSEAEWVAEMWAEAIRQGKLPR